MKKNIFLIVMLVVMCTLTACSNVEETEPNVGKCHYEKGKKLTFAQEWVKKINTSYSEYCEKEKHLAKEFYQEFVSKLISTPVEKIKTCDGYTLFMYFKIEPKSSSKCASFVRKLMLRDGIEELFENGSYEGIKVST